MLSCVCVQLNPSVLPSEKNIVHTKGCFPKSNKASLQETLQVVPPTTTADLVTCVCENKKIVQVMKRGRQKSRNKCLCSHYRAAVSTFHKEPDPRAGLFGIPCSNETLGGEPQAQKKLYTPALLS